MRHKTALGKPFDMQALIAKNEKVRAVGNMNVNARGDKIDNLGRVVKPSTQRVNDSYSKTVGNKSAQVKSGPVERPNKPKKQEIKEELNEYEKQMSDMFEEEDLEIEKLKGKKSS